jgi:glycerophosphoryl diester phosphodiesterase
LARSILNIAHRGASADFPENTLGAFAAAIDAGADMCELDVQSTADRELVVIHDNQVNRTTSGSGPVAKFKAEKIFRLDAGGWFSPRFAGERIPSLDQVFELTRGKCALNVEIKAEGIEQAVVDCIRRWRAEPDTLVSSFDWAAIGRVRELAPEIQVGLLSDRKRNLVVSAASTLGAAAINPRYDLIHQLLCDEAHKRGLKVYGWTIDDPATMRRLIEIGVDGIMSNYPGRLREILHT